MKFTVEDLAKITKLAATYYLMYGENKFCSLENGKDFISELGENQSLKLFIDYLNEQINSKDYFVLKNFGTEKHNLIAICHLLKREIFYSKKLASYIYGFTTEPFSDDLSKNLRAGFFHTDFSAEDNPPNFVILQCVETDPKHPYYGRNQIASVNKILEKLQNIFPDINIIEKLVGLKIPYKFPNSDACEIKLLEKENNNFRIRFHPRLVDDKNLNKNHYIGGVFIMKVIEEIALEVSEDICLEKGDILIMSNKYVLHRRGECSVKFIKSINKWEGRTLNTLRFY